MSFGRYFKSIVWELLLCVAMVDGIGVPLMDLFYAAEAVPKTLLRLSLVALALLLVLYLGIYHKLALLISLLGAVAVLLALNLFLPVPKLVLVQNAAPMLGPVFWYLVGALLALLLYLGTLTPLGTALMFFLGTAATVVLILLGERHSLPLFLLFLWACGCLYFFRRTESLQPAEGGTPHSLVAATALFCAVSLALGALVWSVAIRPLDYETRTLPFLQETQEPESSASAEESDEPSETVSPSPSESSQEPTSTPTSTPSPTPSPAETPQEQSESDGPEGDSGEERGETPIFLLKILFWLLVLALCVFYPQLRRRLFLRRLSRRSPEEQGTACYLRLQRQLHYLGLPAVGVCTPAEYAALSVKACPWLEELSPGWQSLTDAYCAALYGDDDWVALTPQLLAFYQGFPAACKKAVGWKYLYLRYVLI